MVQSLCLKTQLWIVLQQPDRKEPNTKYIVFQQKKFKINTK